MVYVNLKTDVMKGTFTNIGLVLIVVLFFSSCKREESLTTDQNRIYSEYNYTYDANSNKTTAEAEFRISHASGKKLELSYPATVRFNGEALAWRRLAGNYSLSSYAAPGNGTFEYQDTEAQAYQNEASLLKSVELPFGLSSINKKSDFFLPWNGDPVQSGETVEITIKAGATKKFRANIVGSTYITIDRNSLTGLVTGQAKIEIERVQIKPLEQGTFAGGKMISTYKGRTVSITITD